MTSDIEQINKIKLAITRAYDITNSINSGNRQLSFSDLKIMDSYNTTYVIRWKTDMITWEFMKELQTCLSLLTGYFEGVLQLSLSTTDDNYIWVECWI